MEVSKLCIILHLILWFWYLQAFGSAWTSRPFLLTKLCTPEYSHLRKATYHHIYITFYKLLFSQLSLFSQKYITKQSFLSLLDAFLSSLTFLCFHSTQQHLQQCTSALPFGSISWQSHVNSQWKQGKTRREPQQWFKISWKEGGK